MLDLDPQAEPLTTPPPLPLAVLREEIRRRVPPPYAPLPADDLLEGENELAGRHDVLALATLPDGPGPRGRMRTACKRALARGLRWLLMRQVEFNAAVVGRVRAATRLWHAVDGNIAELHAATTALQREVDRLETARLEADRRLAALRAELASLRARAMAPAAPPTPPAGAASVNAMALAERLSGPREETLRRLRAYLDYFQDVGKVLDVACGRGEFVELLDAEGVAVQGVDPDPDLAASCRGRGLPAAHADGAAYLAELDDGSLGGVFLGGAAERVPPAGLARLLGRCRRKLRPGGVVVAEALNPACPSALADFYNDPARVRPLPAELLHFLFEAEGFRVHETLFATPVGGDVPPTARVAEGLPARAAWYYHYAVVGHR
jgi:SAM-dependent methyltransferase